MTIFFPTFFLDLSSFKINSKSKIEEKSKLNSTSIPPKHAYMWSWGKTCDSFDAIPSVTMGSCKSKTPLMNSNMTLTVLNLYQKTPKGATSKIQVERYKRDKIVSHILVER